MSKDSYPVRWAGRQAVVVLPEHIGHANAGQVSEELPSVTNRIVRRALSLSGLDHLISIYLLGHRVDSLIPDGLREAQPGDGTAFAQATMAPASRNGGTAGRGTHTSVRDKTSVTQAEQVPEFRRCDSCIVPRSLA